MWELYEAYLGVQQDEWDRHSRMYALLANANRDPKRQRKPYAAEQFNPYAEKRRQSPVPKVSMGALMDAVFDRNAGRMANELVNHGECRSNSSR